MVRYIVISILARYIRHAFPPPSTSLIINLSRHNLQIVRVLPQFLRKMHFLSTAVMCALLGTVYGFPPRGPHQRPDPPPHLDDSMLAALKALGKSPEDFRLPGSIPNQHAPAGSDQLPGIDHIVMLMLENHSYDNIWGTLDRPDAEGWPIEIGRAHV